MDAGNWFKMFREESSRSFANDEDTDLGSCRSRYWRRKEVAGAIRGEEWESHNAEWTTLMGSFLASMADSLDMTQEWEWAPTSALRGRDDIPPEYLELLPNAGGVDFAWFLEGAPRPSIIIEHENDVTSNNGKKVVEDVEKLAVRLLLCPDKSLAVLITYPWEGHAGFAEKDILALTALAAPLTSGPKGQLLLVLGNTGKDEWTRLTWDGHLWNGIGWDRL